MIFTKEQEHNSDAMAMPKAVIAGRLSFVCQCWFAGNDDSLVGIGLIRFR